MFRSSPPSEMGIKQLTHWTLGEVKCMFRIHISNWYLELILWSIQWSMAEWLGDKCLSHSFSFLWISSVLRWMPLNTFDDKSTLAQVMAWCCQAPSHYLSRCWPSSMSPYGITRPQWVENMLEFIWKYHSTNMSPPYSHNIYMHWCEGYGKILDFFHLYQCMTISTEDYSNFRVIRAFSQPILSILDSGILW